MPPAALILKEKKKRLTLQNNTWSSGCLAPRPHEDVSKQCRQRRPNVSYQENHLPACLQSEADHEELPWCLQHQPGRALPHHQGDGEPLFIDPMLLTGISSPLASRITLNVAALVCVWAQVSLSLTVSLFLCCCVVTGAVCAAPGFVFIQQRIRERDQHSVVQRPGSHRRGDRDFPLSNRWEHPQPGTPAGGQVHLANVNAV